MGERKSGIISIIILGIFSIVYSIWMILYSNWVIVLLLSDLWEKLLWINWGVLILWFLISAVTLPIINKASSNDASIRKRTYLVYSLILIFQAGTIALYFIFPLAFEQNMMIIYVQFIERTIGFLLFIAENILQLIYWSIIFRSLDSKYKSIKIIKTGFIFRLVFSAAFAIPFLMDPAFLTIQPIINFMGLLIFPLLSTGFLSLGIKLKRNFQENSKRSCE